MTETFYDLPTKVGEAKMKQDSKQQHHDDYVNAKAKVKQLKQQAEAIQQRKADCLTRKAVLGIDLERSKRQSKNDEKSYILGQISDEQIHASREKVRQIETELDEINIFLENVDSVLIDSIPRQIVELNNAITKARQRYYAAVCDPIIDGIRNNETLKDELQNAYVAQISGNLGAPKWEFWLASILPSPTHEEIQLKSKAFRESHGL